MAHVQTFHGPVEPDQLEATLVHEHIFVGSPELALNHPHPEWDESEAIERAVRGLTTLYELGIRTVVDLTVLGLGRDVARVASVARRAPVRLVASTGYYATDVLPAFFQTHGPGRLVECPDPLIEFFVNDIERGIAGTDVCAGMLKVVTGEQGITEDVARVMSAAAIAHQQTGVPITTHSHPPSRNGLDQQEFLRRRSVSLDRVVIGHSGDTDDLDYLRRLIDNGSFVGMDRFGMEHLMPDERRVETVLDLLRLGYEEGILLSQDAAYFSRVTPPSWREEKVPQWNHENVSRRILPMLRAGGASESQLEQVMVANPRRLLEPSCR